jgi:3'-5' exonuclease
MSSFGTLRLFPTYVVLPPPMVMMAKATTKSAPRWAISFQSTSITQSFALYLIAHRDNEHWIIDALGAPHVGDRSERELITSFVNRIAELSPQLVTFNGSEFDLPVLRYRATVHKVTAIGLSARPYFHRYTEAIDLCDVLCSFSSHRKASLHELCRVMGLPGKPADIRGEDVEKYYRAGRIREIADYCESDVVNTYQLWLRHELFRGNLTEAMFQASETNLAEFIKARGNTKPHLADLVL